MTRTRRRKRVVAGSALAVMAAVAITMLTVHSEAGGAPQEAQSLASAESLESVVVATVNGEPVSLLEFRSVMLSERAKVVAYFQGVHGAEDSPDFWETAYDEEIPLERLKEATLRKLLVIKVGQIAARRQGLLQDLRYTSFLVELKQENERRRKELDRGRPIYGPRQYEENVYYELRQKQLLDDLKQAMKERLGATEQELQAYYATNKRDFLKDDGISYYSLDEVKEGIAGRMLDIRFGQFMQEQVDRAELVVYEQAAKSIRDLILRGR